MRQVCKKVVAKATDIIKRVFEHKNKLVEGFTTKNKVDKLGYYEQHDSI